MKPCRNSPPYTIPMTSGKNGTSSCSLRPNSCIPQALSQELLNGSSDDYQHDMISSSLDSNIGCYSLQLFDKYSQLGPLYSMLPENHALYHPLQPRPSRYSEFKSCGPDSANLGQLEGAGSNRRLAKLGGPASTGPRVDMSYCQYYGC